MSKRRRGERGQFYSTSADSGSLEDIADAGYGTPVEFKGESKRIVAKPISIFSIYPDAMQPRNVFPSKVRAVWDGTPDTVAAALQHWVALVEGETGAPFALGDYVEAAVATPEEPAEGQSFHESSPTPLLARLLDLVALAGSIKRDGLTNPITIAREESDAFFWIETGERRWLAFHLLHLLHPAEEWDKIPARVVDRLDVWRQAAENSARDDLNAIGKARQLALLIMDLCGRENFRPFHETVHGGEADRAFYAQVADGNVWRVPRGKGEQLLQASGLKSMGQVRAYRALLRLPDEIWMQADDFNLSEYELRTMGYTVSVETLSQPDPPAAFAAPDELTPPDPPTGDPRPPSPHIVQRTLWRWQAGNAVQVMKKLPPDERARLAHLFAEWSRALSEPDP